MAQTTTTTIITPRLTAPSPARTPPMTTAVSPGMKKPDEERGLGEGQEAAGHRQSGRGSEGASAGAGARLTAWPTPAGRSVTTVSHGRAHPGAATGTLGTSWAAV